MLGWFLAGLIFGGLFAVFMDDIMDWAKDVFERLSSYVKKAWVYIRRVPGGIKHMLRYIQNGTMYEESDKTEVEWSEIVRMHDNGEIDDDTFNALKAEREKKIGEIDRER